MDVYEDVMKEEEEDAWILLCVVTWRSGPLVVLRKGSFTVDVRMVELGRQWNGFERRGRGRGRGIVEFYAAASPWRFNSRLKLQACIKPS